MKRLVAFTVLFTSVCIFAQTNAPKDPRTDADKIADALKAGPVFVTKDATVVDWPTTKGRASIVFFVQDLTAGPACRELAWRIRMSLGCYDPAFFQWIKDTSRREDTAYRPCGYVLHVCREVAPDQGSSQP